LSLFEKINNTEPFKVVEEPFFDLKSWLLARLKSYAESEQALQAGPNLAHYTPLPQEGASAFVPGS
jgi:hypothetical protein